MFGTTYYVPEEQLRLSQRLARASFAFLTFTFATYIVHHFGFSRGTPMNWEDYTIDAVLAFGTDYWTSKRKGFEIQIGNDEIRMRGESGYNKCVRRGRIRYLREVSGGLLAEPALRLSEHGAILTRFLGCVWIPASLPQYEQIKALAKSWRWIG